MSDLLKVRLSELENRATAIEKVVLRQLISLEAPMRKDRYRVEEGKVKAMLSTLDQLQDEIDATIAELKAAGEWVPLDYSGNVYRYTPPKVKTVPPAPMVEHKPHKVYPIQSKAELKRAAEKAARAARVAERQAARESREAEKQAAREAREADRAARANRLKPVRVPKPPKPKNVRPPKIKPAPRPKLPTKSAELLKAERSVYDAKRDIGKLEAQFEARRIKDTEWIAEAETRLIEYANTSKADGGPQKRFQARDLMNRAQARLDALPVLKAQRMQELRERLEMHEAEVKRLSENRSQMVK